MDRLFKLLVPVAAASVGFGIGLLLFMGGQREVQRLAQQVSLANQHVAQLEIQKQEFEKTISGFSGERKEFTDRVVALRLEISETLQRSRADLQQLEGQDEALQRRLVELTNEREAARQDAEQFAEDQTRLERAVQRSRQRFALLDRDYRKLQQQAARQQASPETAAYPGPSQIVGSVRRVPPSVTQPSAPPRAATVASASPKAIELPPVVVRSESAGAFQQVLGYLIGVNEPLGFVVVDRGSEDGVHVGMSFDLLRGTALMGRAVAVRVRPQLSACDIAGANTSGPLHIGDIAVQRGL